MSWVSGTFGGNFISWGPLLDRGVAHGFGDRGFSYISEERANLESHLREILKVGSVALTKQVHGVGVVRAPVRAIDQEGDILVGALGVNTALVIKTADCVPLIIVGKAEIAVVHAGWRGLAAGAVEAGLRSVGNPELVLIGPAAGGCCYEVGGEVVSALAKYGAFEKRGDKIFVDTMQTAGRIVSDNFNNVEIQTVGFCTICSAIESDLLVNESRKHRYNSYRRDGGLVRNITFACI